MKTVILDVDDVLFNTPVLKGRLEEIADERSVEIEALRTPEMIEELAAEQSDFFKECVYPHATTFIKRMQENGYRCVLLSSAQSSKSSEDATEAQLEFQRKKIFASGLTELVGGEENVRVVPGEKGEALAEFAGSENFFIDNDIKHLRATEEYGIQPIHLVREHIQQSAHPESLEPRAERMLRIPNLESLIDHFEREGLLAKERKEQE